MDPNPAASPPASALPRRLIGRQRPPASARARRPVGAEVATEGLVHRRERDPTLQCPVEQQAPLFTELDARLECGQRGCRDGETALLDDVLRRELAAPHAHTGAPAWVAPPWHRDRHRRRRPLDHAVPPGGGEAAEDGGVTRPERSRTDPHLVVVTVAAREIDPGMQRPPAPQPQPVVDRFAREAGAQRLVTGDHAGLTGEDAVDGHAATDAGDPAPVPGAATPVAIGNTSCAGHDHGVDHVHGAPSPRSEALHRATDLTGQAPSTAATPERRRATRSVTTARSASTQCDLRQLVRSHPARSRVFECLRLGRPASSSAGAPGAPRRRSAGRYRAARSTRTVGGQLLAALPHHRFRLRLPRLHSPAG